MQMIPSQTLLSNIADCKKHILPAKEEQQKKRDVPGKFYVEIPQDKCWNTYNETAVIEVVEDRAEYFQVLAPESFKRLTPSVKKAHYVACSGPARLLRRDDYIKVIQEVLPEKLLPISHNPKVILME